MGRSRISFKLLRELSLARDGSLETRPVAELESIRASKLFSDRGETDENPERLAGAEGDAIEIVATVNPQEATSITVSVLETPDGAERTRIIVDLADGVLRVDVSAASFDKEITYHHPDTGQVTEQAAPIAMESGKKFDLRIFVDRSIVEVF